jgi:hypothetical protein
MAGMGISEGHAMGAGAVAGRGYSNGWLAGGAGGVGGAGGSWAYAKTAGATNSAVIAMSLFLEVMFSLPLQFL